MPITEMQHYMVLSKDLERPGTSTEVLGLRIGPRPPFDFDGYWIYVGEVAVVHVAGQASYEETGRLGDVVAERHGSGSVDHIAFAANNYDELIASFNKHGVKYRATQVPASDLRQLFVFDPDGIQIEINIRANASRLRQERQ